MNSSASTDSRHPPWPMLSLPKNPFSRLTSLLADLSPPAGHPPLAMHLGDPQEGTPAWIAEIIAAHQDAWGRYPPADGLEAYREACAAWLRRRFGVGPDLARPDHVIALSGTREGLFQAALLGGGLGLGRLAVVPDPGYHVYEAAARTAGLACLMLRPAAPGGLPALASLGPPELDQIAIAYICNPTNPEGGCSRLEDLIQAIHLARRHGFILLVDECYADLYHHSAPPGVLQACDHLGDGARNVLAFHSLSKRSSAGGLRCGFVTGDPELVARFRALRSFGGAQVPVPIQMAGAALWADDQHAAEVRRAYGRKIQLAQTLLGPLGGPPPAAGFFLWPEVGDGEAVARRAWAESGIRIMPGAYMASDDPAGGNLGHRHVRISVVHAEEVLAEALPRLAAVLARPG